MPSPLIALTVTKQIARFIKQSSRQLHQAMGWMEAIDQILLSHEEPMMCDVHE